MPNTANIVQLKEPTTLDRQGEAVFLYPVTLAKAVLLDGAVDVQTALSNLMSTDEYTELVSGVRKIKASKIPELNYLLAKTFSTTGSPYVQEVSVNQAGDTLIVKTWSKETNGVLRTEEIAIVGENTTYSISPKYNTETDPNETPNSSIRLTDNNSNFTDAVVPVGALRNDNGVSLIIDGNFYPTN